MKKILFILCIVSTLCCMAQKKYPTPHEVTEIFRKENYSDLNTNAIYEVKIYIIDSYHWRTELVKELIYVYNINYVRTHYSTYIYTLERNTLLPRARKWQPTSVFLPGKSHGQRSLVGCSPRGP